MAWTTPRTWVPGELVTASMLNTHVRDNLNMLARTDVANTLTGLQTFATGQLKFPATQNPSSDANTLDDYEEGAWVPTIVGSGGQSGQVYAAQSGIYIKIGRLVFVQGRIDLSTLGTITGTVRIGGLPFTTENSANNTSVLTFGYVANLAAATFSQLGGLFNSNASTADIYGFKGAATGTSAPVQADLTNTTTLIFSGCYRSAA